MTGTGTWIVAGVVAVAALIVIAVAVGMFFAIRDIRRNSAAARLDRREADQIRVEYRSAVDRQLRRHRYPS
jgi:uncharacterized membrane protein